MKKFAIPFLVSALITLAVAQIPIGGGGSGGGGGTSVTVSSPYFVIGGTNYSNTGYAITKPPASPSFLSSAATVTAGANGDLQLTSCADDCFVTINGSTSVESEYRCYALQTPGSLAFSHCAIWLWDSTNNLIYSLYPSYADHTNGGTVIWFFQQWTYNGVGNPVFSVTLNTIDGDYSAYSQYIHTKLSVSAGTITAAVSFNGGANFLTLATHAIGTVTKGGCEMSSVAVMNIISLKVQ